MPAPSVGRIVHYRSYGTPGGEYQPECRAAIVTEVTDCAEHTDCAGLFVANPTGLFLNQHVARDDEQRYGGTWHWPERI